MDDPLLLNPTNNFLQTSPNLLAVPTDHHDNPNLHNNNGLPSSSSDQQPSFHRNRRPSWARPLTPQTRRIIREEDEEWSTPVAKILQLYYDHESWQQAQEILEEPGSMCRKIGDEARSIAARHIIDRLKEKNFLNKIHKVAPRLRSAVELLSKPDADYVYPHFQYVVNEMRDKYPDVYDSVIQNVRIRIPSEMKPSHILVSLAKSTIEDQYGEIQMSWGKFVALLGLCGALAVDSVDAGYPEGVAEIVETFGIIVEQAMGDWIVGMGGGWIGFIKLNVYRARIPPVTRTFVIIFLFLVCLYVGYWLIYFCLTLLVDSAVMRRNAERRGGGGGGGLEMFFGKWYSVGGRYRCYEEEDYYDYYWGDESSSSSSSSGVCRRPLDPLEGMIVAGVYYYRGGGEV